MMFQGPRARRRTGGRLGRLLAIAALALLAGCSRREHLVVYTAAEADQIFAYKQAFARLHPEIDLVWVRDSTGVITSRLLAERKAPRADVVFALAASSMMQLDKAGLLAAYAPAGLDRIDARFRDRRSPPRWTGEALWSAAICLNTTEARRRGLPTPQSWLDRTKPIYRGMISMPDPGSSGTGLMAVSSWLQTFGEAGGWAFMDGLDRNVAAYAHSGSKPCKDASHGEIPIGIAIDYRAAQAQARGLPIAVIVPKEGLGWDVEATGVMRTARHPAQARAFADWALSDSAMALYARTFAVVGVPAWTRTVPGLPQDMPARLAPIDLAWTGVNRDRVIAEWTRRYGERRAQKEKAR